MIEGLQINIPQRMKLVRITLTLSLVISLLLTFNLWGGHRSFPYSPVFENLRPAAPFDIFFVILLIILLMSSLFVVRLRLIISLAITVSLFLVLGDVNRIQPWFYIYTSMLFVFVFYNGRVDDSNQFTGYFILLQIIFASVYFFCGISQLNPHFVNTDFEKIISPLKQIVSDRQFGFLVRMGLFVPYLLIFVGIGLIIPTIRYLAISLVVLMHLFLLILLFPSSQNYSYSLWFSNLPFACMSIFLFSGKTKQRYFSPTYLFKMPLSYPVFLFFVIMPFFNKKGFWPDYLSSNFKSGNTRAVRININSNIYNNLPLFQRHFCQQKESNLLFEYNKWCATELNVECFPSQRVFNSIYVYLKNLDDITVKEIELAVTNRQN